MKTSCALLFGLLCATTTHAQVRISEFHTLNLTLPDSQGNLSDWIEIENTGPSTVDLGGWYLTDNSAVLTLWALPTTTIPAGGFLLVRASGMDLTAPELHTNFSLSSNGEYLALVFPDGLTIADEYAPQYPEQFSGISYGLGINGQSQPAEGHFLVPTPGATNGQVAQAVAPVEYTSVRGFYDAPISVGLSCTTPNVLMYYTLDGTEPDETKTLYTALIPVTTTTIVRAAAFVIGEESITRSTTSSYIYLNDVLNQSDAGAVAQGFPADWISRNGIDWDFGGSRPGATYGLDSTILAQYTTQQLIDSLKAIPTMSLSMSIDDWFGYNPPDGLMGIYVNSEDQGPAWDRAGSVEYLDPNGGNQFQLNCGLAIQGGSSTGSGLRAQLSIALKIRTAFGPSKLEFPLFDDTLNDDFEYLILDGGNQNSISSPGNISYKRHTQSLRDQFTADLQRMMGGLTSHGTYVHTYINGLYWGLCNLHERPDTRWASEYFGGDDLEYDWVKEGGIVAGNSNPANHPSAPGVLAVINEITGTGMGDGVMYMGQPAYEAFQDRVNLANYVDYMNLNFYGGNTDWPHRNWMATSHSRLSPAFGNLNPDQEFLFHSWDAENCLGWEGVTSVGGFYDRTQVVGSNGTNIAYYYTELQANSEYALFHADRAHRILFNNGPLYVDPAYSAPGTVFDPAFPERNRPAAHYHQLAAKIEGTIPMAFARWVNYFLAPGTLTPADWFIERDRILNDYFSVRSNVLLDQLRNKGLYPNIVAPTFNQHGGEIPLGFNLTMSAPAGTIYYTLDESDPRLPGGAINPTASVYSTAIPILDLTTAKARAYDGIEWSALNEATFSVGLPLRINEIMASNATTVTDEVGQFEDYVELYNDSPTPVELSGMYLSDNPAFPAKWPFPNGTTIPAGGTILIWCDEDATDGPLHANFKLNKDGEQIGLYHTDAASNLQIDYVAFGPQTTDVGLARIPDGSNNLLALLDPTPDASNIPVQGTSLRYDMSPPTLNPRDLTITGNPVLGQTMMFDYSGGTPGGVGVQILGSTTLRLSFSAQSWVILVPGFQSLWTLFPADGSGSGSVLLPVPNTPGLIGMTGYVQGWLTGEFSNGVVLTIGP